MSARQRKRILRIRKSKSKKSKFTIFLILLALCVSVFFYLVVSRRYWNGEDSLSLVASDDSGAVYVVNFNPIANEITKITIPSNTEVEVANNLGLWKLGSVWKLGYQEGKKGLLLAQTLTHHLKIPVFVWSDNRGLGLAGSEPASLVKSVFAYYDTNLSFGDKLGLAFFSLGVDNTDRIDFKLEESGYLVRTRLTDGKEGYTTKGNLPPTISAIFTHPILSDENYKISVKDSTDMVGLVEDFSEVIQSLGGKVTSITNGEASAIKCEVRVKEEKIRQLMVNLFDCRSVGDKLDANFDLEINIGKAFARDY